MIGDLPPGEGSLASLVNVLVLPLYLRDLVFLGSIDPDSPLTGVANGGLFAVGIYVVILLAGSGVLLYRYRWVER